MKLSQKILKGCELSAPTRLEFIRTEYVDNHVVHSTCAMGAAVLADTGLLPGLAKGGDHPDWSVYSGAFNELSRQIQDICVSCPVCGKASSHGYLSSVITHLNDYHSWPREKIARWLDEEHAL